MASIPMTAAEVAASDAAGGIEADRAALEAAWLTLTREILPPLAADRDWPVHADHCLQRILLDTACVGCWYDHIAGRPAYRHASTAILARALALGAAVVAGMQDLGVLDDRSLAWRGKVSHPRWRRVRRSPTSRGTGDRT